MHLAIIGMTGNIDGMVAHHPSTRGLPLILSLSTPVVWGHYADFHL